VDFSVIVPIFLGLIASGLVNYLADVLPQTLRLSQPTCSNADCQAALGWTDYLLLRRCRKCGRGRGLRAFAVLILCVALALYTWFAPPLKLGFYPGIVVLTYLLLVALIDLEHRLILRPLSIAGLVLAAAAGIFARGWLSTLVGGGAGFLMLFALYQFGRLFARWRAKRLGKTDDEEALGSGDVTLATILGLLLGWPLIWYGLLLGILFSGVTSLIIILVLLIARRYKTQMFNVFIPYGIFFILGAFMLIYAPLWMSEFVK
jgi:leader peptidase (prepilin peptidase)/N-methyltransferase